MEILQKFLGNFSSETSTIWLTLIFDEFIFNFDFSMQVIAKNRDGGGGARPWFSPLDALLD